MSTWTLYILKCNDDSLYTGITNNLEKRVSDHEAGIGAKYTRGRGPFEIVYQEKLEDRSSASKREFAIKKLSKLEKEKLIKK
ncbi:GIY-YIG nuclease family protein [Emcibacteraceae bacterium]|jgi:putative endonuclease|nr:GIY-YIG nuclease family protein [Emcibacteraceae bacterium]MDA9554276.1 GIY-YIG nuclease family protein [Emcibacteraceae bacterium]MDA9771417.1 GIY-YIG nuclease family protein [Emcibacteraceae bacterium]